MSWPNADARKRWRLKYKTKIAEQNRLYYLKNKEKCNANSRKWRKANREKWAVYQRRHKLKQLYNLTMEGYESLLASQGGHCKFCERSKDLCVDHDHRCCAGPKSCGKCVRFILCHPHNKFIGWLESKKNQAVIDWFLGR